VIASNQTFVAMDIADDGFANPVEILSHQVGTVLLIICVFTRLKKKAHMLQTNIKSVDLLIAKDGTHLLSVAFEDTNVVEIFKLPSAEPLFKVCPVSPQLIESFILSQM
jgi:hypothetical protein